ncbi:hypothetical protein SUGI_0807840 [Cryptomeria japonica]|uniref:E3 ubiquitin-protein ligase ATL31 n=1 Tax=Cryptomeria japonica TaxID=3369 RepID=UPI0024146F7A|nr:E3 ubiquitin-protein ligase ATL31 [Cryptomeria japonica]GLJ39534.1 hypothetical protein SUGI_0807840 [Cryptomeria japonica]
MDSFLASSATDKRNSFFVINPTSAPSLKIVSLADQNPYGTPDANYNDISFNPSLAILIVALFSFIFMIMIFSICICRRVMTVEEGSRAFRRPGVNNNTRGLEQTVIESFSVFSYSLVKGLKSQAKGSECTVCLSDFGDDEMVRLLPKCSHAFHPECIDMWLCSHTTCPICRVSLVPGDDSTPTATVEPQTTPEHITIVVDNGNNEAPETTNDSTGHSLVMVRKEMEQPTEWYIATPRGLTPGLHRSCSFVAGHPSQAASTSNAPPACPRPGSSVDDVERRSKSERWGNGSKNPSSFLRSFSERVALPPGERRGMEQPSHKAYLRRTFSWLMGRERERNRPEGSENISVSSRHYQIAV